MDVGDTAIWRAVQQRRRTNVIPHLSGDHGHAEGQRQHAPHTLVEQELEVVATHVQETGDQRAQQQNHHDARVAWRAHDTELDVGALLHEFGQRFGRESGSLQVQCVGGCAFRCEMRVFQLEYRESVERMQCGQAKMAAIVRQHIPLRSPLAGKCMNTGAVFSRNRWNTSEPSSKSTMAKYSWFENASE